MMVERRGLCMVMCGFVPSEGLMRLIKFRWLICPRYVALLLRNLQNVCYGIFRAPATRLQRARIV